MDRNFDYPLLHLTPVVRSSLSINGTWLDLRPSEIFLTQDPLYKLTHISINKRDRAKRLKSSLLWSISICLLRIWARSGEGPEKKFSENFLVLIKKIYYSLFLLILANRFLKISKIKLVKLAAEISKKNCN